MEFMDEELWPKFGDTKCDAHSTPCWPHLPLLLLHAAHGSGSTARPVAVCLYQQRERPDVMSYLMMSYLLM